MTRSDVVERALSNLVHSRGESATGLGDQTARCGWTPAKLWDYGPCDYTRPDTMWLPETACIKRFEQRNQLLRLCPVCWGK